jgi:hypothetical protein
VSISPTFYFANLTLLRKKQLLETKSKMSHKMTRCDHDKFY